MKNFLVCAGFLLCIYPLFAQKAEINLPGPQDNPTGPEAWGIEKVLRGGSFKQHDN